jgi:hypothetical protein
MFAFESQSQMRSSPSGVSTIQAQGGKEKKIEKVCGRRELVKNDSLRQVLHAYFYVAAMHLLLHMLGWL